MRVSRRAQSRTRRRGFSLVEILIVLAILGLALGMGLSGMNSMFKRQRLGSAAEELKSLAGRALTESQNRNVSTFLAFGHYVANVGTDVAVVVDANGDGVLNEAVDPNNDGLFDDAATNVVIMRYRVPVDVALSSIAPTGQMFNAQWSRPASGSVSAAILCDFMGRAMIPGATPAMITGPATVQLSHRDMISGSLTPLVTYTLSIGPLFKATVTRVP